MDSTHFQVVFFSFGGRGSYDDFLQNKPYTEPHTDKQEEEVTHSTLMGAASLTTFAPAAGGGHDVLSWTGSYHLLTLPF